MIEKNRILKLFIFTIIAVLACLSVFAADTEGTSFNDKGSPVTGKLVKMDVGFTYDPGAMQYLAFGFTSSDDINPLDVKNNSTLSLRTQVMQGRGELARGKGNINFYWVLRTNKAVSAKLYLKDHLTEMKSSDNLDWSIKFDSTIDGMVNHGLKIDKYGIENAVPIFSKTDTSMQNLVVGSLPIEVVTDYAPVKLETQTYSGTVGLLVETN